MKIFNVLYRKTYITTYTPVPLAREENGTPTKNEEN